MAEPSTPVPFLDSTAKPLPKLPKVIRPGTCAAIFNERGEILLPKQADNGFWSMPGGAVDPGESAEQGALREVREETGLQVRVVRLVEVYSDPRNYMITHYPGGDIVHKVSLCFVCEWVAGTLQLSDESTDTGYFPRRGITRADDAFTSHTSGYPGATA